jgi:hypothetical protein
LKINHSHIISIAFETVQAIFCSKNLFAVIFILRGYLYDKTRPNQFCSKLGNLHEKIQLGIWRREKGGHFKFFGPSKMHVKSFFD